MEEAKNQRIMNHSHATQHQKNQQPEICPRCESAGPEALSHSPVEGAWTVFHCPTCFFTWRNTEPDFITDPRKYNPNFKFSPADMAHFGVMPAIPELKNKG